MAKKQIEGKFPVVVTEDVFAEGNGELVKVLKAITGAEAPRVTLVADSNVVQRTEGLGSKIGRYFQAYGVVLAGPPVVVSGGEKIKSDNFQTAVKIATALVDARIGVDDVVIAMGGGTLLDVAGWAASQVRGGIRILRMPTTVASMVDAAFAECAALDAPGVKDAFRVPCLPAAVVVDTAFAKTVLDGVWRGGFAEAVRLAAVSDAALVKRLAKRAEAIKARDYEALRESVAECVELREKKGDTPFAHWCAARLEAMSGYKLPHGYAVAIAICIDCAYAVGQKIMKESDQELVCRVLAECGSLDGLVHSHHLLSQPDNIMLGLDAWKLATGSSGITLPSALGKCKVEEMPDREAYVSGIKEFLSVSQAE